MDLPKRFMFNFVENHERGCWFWFGSSRSTGYGGFFHEGKMHLAHRFAYERVRGPIPEGMECDHLCGVRRCVNPWHIHLVSHKENMGRARMHNARKTHCPKGHRYDIVDANGRRRCRRCVNERVRARNAAITKT